MPLPEYRQDTLHVLGNLPPGYPRTHQDQIQILTDSLRCLIRRTMCWNPNQFLFPGNILVEVHAQDFIHGHKIDRPAIAPALVRALERHNFQETNHMDVDLLPKTRKRPYGVALTFPSGKDPISIDVVSYAYVSKAKEKTTPQGRACFQSPPNLQKSPRQGPITLVLEKL